MGEHQKQAKGLKPLRWEIKDGANQMLGGSRNQNMDLGWKHSAISDTANRKDHDLQLGRGCIRSKTSERSGIINEGMLIKIRTGVNCLKTWWPERHICPTILFYIRENIFYSSYEKHWNIFSHSFHSPFIILI